MPLASTASQPPCRNACTPPATTTSDACLRGVGPDACCRHKSVHWAASGVARACDCAQGQRRWVACGGRACGGVRTEVELPDVGRERVAVPAAADEQPPLGSGTTVPNTRRPTDRQHALPRARDCNRTVAALSNRRQCRQSLPTPAPRPTEVKRVDVAAHCAVGVAAAVDHHARPDDHRDVAAPRRPVRARFDRLLGPAAGPERQCESDRVTPRRHPAAVDP